MQEYSYSYVITMQQIEQYTNYLHEQEKSTATIQQYKRTITAVSGYFSGTEITKTALIT